MLDSKLAGSTLRDAEAFIKFMMSVSTYEALVFPSSGPPRYLLSAREDVYSNDHFASFPLYLKFRKLIGIAMPVTGEGLNAQLHNVAKEIEKSLASNP